MTNTIRLSTGIEGLDELLGGGLMPGTLTAVVGSTGIGKTQFGLQFAYAGVNQEGRTGILFDMCSRGDSQNHADYDPGQIGCMLLITSQETTLDGLIERPLDEGDVLSNANTIIHLGKIREGNRFRRAMYITKHRGSVCTDEIIPYSIDERGLRLE